MTVALPLLLELAVKAQACRRPVPRLGRIAILTVDLGATLFLIGIIYFLSPTLVGFLYVRATAAPGAATAPSCRFGAPRPRRAPTPQPVSEYAVSVGLGRSLICLKATRLYAVSSSMNVLTPSP